VLHRLLHAGHRVARGIPLVNVASRIPLLVAQLPDTDALLPYLRQIDANRWYTNFGPLVTQLEQRFAASLAATPEAPKAISAASGTAGLELVLGALELPTGANVLLPALTFVATATAVIRSGYRPLIGDVDASSWLLTPETAREYAARHRVDAVMPVATFGNPQDVEAWDAFVADTGIPVVIDAAGAYGNQRVGRRCHVVFSLHATKALAAGEGGMVVSYDHALAARVRRLSNFGIDLERGSQVFVAGENGKLSIPRSRRACGAGSVARHRRTATCCASALSRSIERALPRSVFAASRGKRHLSDPGRAAATGLARTRSATGIACARHRNAPVVLPHARPASGLCRLRRRPAAGRA
jgi:hypothetical protein